MDEKPVVFSIMKVTTDFKSFHYLIYGIDERGKGCEYIKKSLEDGHTNSDDLYEDMMAISDEMYKKGYIAVFAVE